MRRCLGVTAAIAALLLASACGPYATADLSYDEVDELFLSDTVIAVASSRSEYSLRTVGSMLFVATDGSIQRIDNGGGLTRMKIALDDGRLGFSDRDFDYVVGAENVKSKRSRADANVLNTVFFDNKLVTVFADAEDRSSEFFVSRTRHGPAWSRESGRAQAVTGCTDGVWVIGETVILDEDNDSVDDEPDGLSLGFRQIEPDGEAAWLTNLGAGEQVSAVTAVCGVKRLIALTSVATEGHPADVVASVNRETGKSLVVPVTGELPDVKLADETVTYETAGLIDRELFVVAGFNDGSAERYVLASIDVDTGESRRITDIEITADVSTHFRISDGVLHVLDVTWKDPSRVRAIRLTDGVEVGSLEFDWLEPAINGRFTTFERKQYVRDFAVLQPERIAPNPTPQ